MVALGPYPSKPQILLKSQVREAVALSSTRLVCMGVPGTLNKDGCLWAPPLASAAHFTELVWLRCIFSSENQ